MHSRIVRFFLYFEGVNSSARANYKSGKFNELDNFLAYGLWLSLSLVLG